MKSYGCSRRDLFEQTDQPALQPLPTQPFVFARWKQAKVNLDYHLEVDKHYYSVPYWFVRREVSVKISESLVEVFFDHRRIAVHPARTAPYRHTTLPEHMPPEHWAYKQPVERDVPGLGAAGGSPDSPSGDRHLCRQSP
jgi:transposase